MTLIAIIAVWSSLVLGVTSLCAIARRGDMTSSEYDVEGAAQAAPGDWEPVMLASVTELDEDRPERPVPLAPVGRAA
jgi:hypothetical protein